MPTQRGKQGPIGGTVFATRLHPVSCAGAAVLGLFLLGITALIIRHNILSTAVAAQVGGVGVGLALTSVAGPLVRLFRSRVLLTGNHLLVRLSMLPRRPRAARLEEIEHVEVHSTWLGGALDYGTLVLSGGGSYRAVLRHVRQARALCSAIERQRGGARRAGSERR
jgi:hypothetical protein